ncbi:hypothetical protein [Desulfobulbus alkaliphilus]|uniref:hypothetical protein n=1 Tax=Desulfobulbus alkaliphilus TaxID=869814 RepID=UPI0019628AC5|nr:hypothetical protein [Desulfobulbus alkaliphilus]MBM9537125.1 hypothetical protein [Desulfobulbus alkaliphilus]
MLLLSFRVIGHPAVADSSWLEVGPNLSIVHTRQSEQAEVLLRALQAINPPFDLHHQDPFADFSEYALGSHHKRRIIPAKKTAALAIYAASPQMVQELAALDPALYETDRIELGRRRDYSRWMNFVELSASSRWQEVEPLIRALLSHVGPEAADAVAPLQTTMEDLQATDRIKGEVATQLREQLERLDTYLPASCQVEMNRCCQSIDRARHFLQAKKAVAARLPLFLALSATTLSADAETAAGGELLSRLVDQLRSSHADQAAFAERLHLLNQDLHTLQPDLNLRFTVQGDQVLLKNRQDGTPQPISRLPPVPRLNALLAGLTALHGALIGCPPIVLLDFQALNLPREEQVELLEVLRRWSLQLQCIVIPNDTLLSLCATETAPAKPVMITLPEP